MPFNVTLSDAREGDVVPAVPKSVARTEWFVGATSWPWYADRSPALVSPGPIGP
jgi:hypothetical protein